MKGFKNLLKKILNNNSSAHLVQFYQYADKNTANWISISINKRSIQQSMLTKELEILTKTNSLSLKIAETKNGIYHKSWINQKAIGSNTIVSSDNYILKFNNLIDKLLAQKLEAFQERLGQIDTNILFTPEEMSIENKALEWMRVSYEILEKAIVHSLTNSDFLFQTLIFIGTNPKNAAFEIRLITFNLDITFEILQNNKLRVRIYNDKDGDFASNKKASLEGDFNYRKREMFDELIKLISAHAAGIKFIF